MRSLFISLKACVLQKLTLEKSYITTLQHIHNFVGLQTLTEILQSPYKRKSYVFPLTYMNRHGALCPLSVTGTHSNAREGHGGGELHCSHGSRRVRVLPPFLIQYCSPPPLFYVYFYFHQLFVCCLSSLPDKKYNAIFGKWFSRATGKYIYTKMCKTCSLYLCMLLCKGAALLTGEGQSPKAR